MPATTATSTARQTQYQVRCGAVSMPSRIGRWTVTADPGPRRTSSPNSHPLAAPANASVVTDSSSPRMRSAGAPTTTPTRPPATTA